MGYYSPWPFPLASILVVDNTFLIKDVYDKQPKFLTSEDTVFHVFLSNRKLSKVFLYRQPGQGLVPSAITHFITAKKLTCCVLRNPKYTQRSEARAC